MPDRSVRATRTPALLAAPPPGTELVGIPGDPGLPVIGSSLAFLRDPLGLARQRHHRYGPVSWTDAFGIRLVGAATAPAAEAVLINKDKAYSNGDGWEYFIGPFFRRGIMLLDFDEHRHHRRIMQQAFTPDRLRGYLAAMNPGIARGLASWRPSDRFPMLTAHKQLTLDLATETFMGVELGHRADQINRSFVHTVRAGLSLVRRPIPGSRWWRGLRARRTLERFFAEHLPAKRAGDGTDLFTALCHARTDDGHRFCDADVVNHMIFLLMAAHDTTTITMTSMAYFLARHPEWQRRLREESLAIGTPALDYADLDRLPSMDLVMKEALRRVPPVPALPRRTVADTELLGHFVPAGTTVSVSILFNHHSEDYWSDPMRFDPERFAPHRREDRNHRHCWTPYGGGVHKCIGMYFAGVQVKAIMHQLLLRFRWSVPDGYEMPIDWSTLPIPKDRLPVRLDALTTSR